MDQTELARNIKRFRDKHSVSQTDFAEMIGMSRQHLSALETGRFTGSISLETFVKICDVLNTPTHVMKFQTLHSLFTEMCEAYIDLAQDANMDPGPFIAEVRRRYTNITGHALVT